MSAPEEESMLQPMHLIAGAFITLIVLGVILGFWFNLQRGALTGPVADLQRVNTELRGAIEHKMDGRDPALDFVAPLNSQNVYSLAIYPENHPQLPSRCQGNTCICVYEQLSRDERKETCKTYKTIHAPCRDDACGKALCVDTFQSFYIDKPQPFYITRSCNRITFRQ